MKKAILWAVLALTVLSGCATRRTRILTPAERAAKVAEAEARQEDLKGRLNLSCPDERLGGRENVQILGDLAKNAWRVQGNGFARFLFARYMGLVEVTNPYNEAVDINEGGRPVVRNMCPHGTITLVAVLGPEAGIIGPGGYNRQEFVWTARRFVNDHLYYGVSQRLELYIYQWEKERKAQWVMKVDDIDRSLPPHPTAQQTRW